MPTSNSESEKSRRRLWLMRALDVGFLALALLSLIYTVVTAPGNGIDFLIFYKGAGEWVTGAYKGGAGSLFAYPPFTRLILSPLTFLPLASALLLWLCLNLIATGLCCHLVFRYFGGWSTRVKFYFTLLILSWAPWRVALRVGQISLIITALILGALVAHGRKRNWLSGILLGLSLCKFTLGFPVFLYFLWKRQWKIPLAAVLLMTLLTWLCAFRLGVSPVDISGQYLMNLGGLTASGDDVFSGSTEIKPLFVWAVGEGNAATILFVIVLLVALVGMAFVFYRRPNAEPVHVALLSLFALWSVYHRTYDSVLYIIPVALLIDLLIRRESTTFSRFWLAASGLLIVSLPGLLTSRLGVPEEVLVKSVAGFLAVHIERLLTLGMFVSLLIFLWRSDAGAAPEAA